MLTKCDQLQPRVNRTGGGHKYCNVTPYTSKTIMSGPVRATARTWRAARKVQLQSGCTNQDRRASKVGRSLSTLANGARPLWCHHICPIWPMLTNCDQPHPRVNRTGGSHMQHKVTPNTSKNHRIGPRACSDTHLARRTRVAAPARLVTVC